MLQPPKKNLGHLRKGFFYIIPQHIFNELIPKMAIFKLSHHFQTIIFGIYMWVFFLGGYSLLGGWDNNIQSHKHIPIGLHFPMLSIEPLRWLHPPFDGPRRTPAPLEVSVNIGRLVYNCLFRDSMRLLSYTSCFHKTCTSASLQNYTYYTPNCTKLRMMFVFSSNPSFALMACRKN